MSITKEQILNAISEMSVMDISELAMMMEKKFGVSASELVAPESVSLDTAKKVVVEEQTEFSVSLIDIGANKIPVIKAVRSITNLGLKEAKELVESAPVLLKDLVSKEDAMSLKKTLEAVGASVEIK